MSEKPVYFLVTEKELYWVKEDCAHPEVDSCNGCEYAIRLGCNFEGSNSLIESIMTRTLELELRKICAECTRPDEMDCDICASQNFDGG